MKKVVIFLLAAILLVTCIAIAEQTDAPTPAETETTETVETEEIIETEETEEVSECPENYFVSGFVMEIMEDGSILILTNQGEEIVIHLHDETINELEPIRQPQPAESQENTPEEEPEILDPDHGKSEGDILDEMTGQMKLF